MRFSQLRELARRYSIETSYTDAAGSRRQASRDALVAAIEKRAHSSLSEAAEAVNEAKVVEPVAVLWGNNRTVDVRLPEGTRVEWDLELEDGSWRSGRAKVFGDTITLDAVLPPGYHTLHMNGEYETFVIAAPMKAAAPRERTWGLFAPLYAAHTRRSWGAGDLGDLLAWTSWVDHHGGGVVATLPMLASFDDEPSPYSPVSRLFWNEMYLDATRLPEIAEEDLDAGEIARLQQSGEVDYDGVRREKRRVLERCAARFTPNSEYERFVPVAREYAAFRARAEGQASDGYHLYVQYRMAQQMRAVANATRRLGSGLYLDFPLGVNASGYDVHRYGHLFAKNVSVGAPPDLFFTKGQNWGFPPFDPDAVRNDRYDYFRAAVRQHASHAGILRIDHVMGLHRLFWIPEGANAADGVYVRYDADELYAVLVIESRRHACVVVGEDLGTVPPEVPKKMNRHGIRQMYVVQYEAKAEQPPLPDPPARSVASINTHDMPTFAAFWSGRDVDDRVEQDLLDAKGAAKELETRDRTRRETVPFLVQKRHLDAWPGEDVAKVYEGIVSFLASSKAEIVLLNPEDFWREMQPQNVPGLPEKSWRHKFRMSLDDARGDGSIRRLLTRVNQQRAHDLLRPHVEPEQESRSAQLEPQYEVKGN